MLAKPAPTAWTSQRPVTNQRLQSLVLQNWTQVYHWPTEFIKSNHIDQRFWVTIRLKRQRHKRTIQCRSQQTQNICISFIQHRPNVFDVGPNQCVFLFKNLSVMRNYYFVACYITYIIHYFYTLNRILLMYFFGLIWQKKINTNIISQKCCHERPSW